MIEISITQDIIDYANNKLEHVNTRDNLGLSKFGSERNRILVGYIGERIIMKYLKLQNDEDKYHYDLISNKGKRLEVKTITCKFKPKDDYWCTVNSHDLSGVYKQNADFYIFLRILNDYSKGWILGWISCEEFFKKGEFIPKGKDFGKFQFVKANATILSIDKLNPFKEDEL
ncbi:hypothetical protein [Algibacter sp. 2305UL17-15]|uniref:hypothetical protein n=1 Tax=Algibacter sp. 2305UL17-15 TaxID=3231268 RepID=UPI003459923B